MTIVPAPRDPDPVEGEVLAGPPPGPHAVSATRTRSGVALVCACLGWEAAVTGPSSLRWAQADHARHVVDATLRDA